MACSDLSTENELYRNKHKNKALYKFILFILYKPTLVPVFSGWLFFVQKASFKPAKTLYLPALRSTQIEDLSISQQARGAWWISLPVLM